MAIIACKECDHKVSDRAASCPNCGAPIGARKHKSSGWQIVIGVALASAALWLIGMTLWTNLRGTHVHSMSAATTNSSAVYQTTADQLYQDYHSNGVATQTRIGNGGIRVSGKVTAIEEDAAGHPIVKLATNHSDSAEMTLTDDQAPAAAQLTRGQNVEVQCGAMRGLGGLPVGSQCTLALVAAASMATLPDARTASTLPAGAPHVPSTTRRPATASVHVHAHSAVSKAAGPAPLDDAPVPVPVPVNSSETTGSAQAAVPVPVPVPVQDAPVVSAVPAASAEPAMASVSQESSLPTTAAAAPDDLATVRQADPAAAEHIASYCASSVAAVNGASYAAGCRRDEKDAWTRFVLNNEFPALDDDTRRKCNEPPFPDSYSAKETCARYHLSSKASTSALR